MRSKTMAVGMAVVGMLLAGAARPDAEDDWVGVSRNPILKGDTVRAKETFVVREYSNVLLYLLTNENFVRSRASVDQMNAAFREMGLRIGDTNLALWFYAKGQPDIDRARRLARSLGLDPVGGPYVVLVPLRQASRAEIRISEKQVEEIPYQYAEVGNDLVEHLPRQIQTDWMHVMDFSSLGADCAKRVLDTIAVALSAEDTPKASEILHARMSCARDKLAKVIVSGGCRIMSWFEAATHTIKVGKVLEWEGKPGRRMGEGADVGQPCK